jgi:hypothetical protein
MVCLGVLAACSAAPGTGSEAVGQTGEALSSCIPDVVSGSVVTQKGNSDFPWPSFTYTAPAATDGLLIVHLDVGSGGSVPFSGKYGSQALTLMITSPDGNNGQQQIWYLVGPTAGAHALTFATSGASVPYNIEVETYEGVQPSLPFGSMTSTHSTSYTTKYTTTLTTQHVNGLMADYLSFGSGDAPTVTLGSGQTESYYLPGAPSDQLSSVLPAYVPTAYSQTYTTSWPEYFWSVSLEIVSWCE